MLYLILGKLFAGVLLLGTPLVLGIMLGRYSKQFNSWNEFINDLFN